jgi:hypothetical protein
MDFSTACQVLDIKAPFTEKALRNAYYSKALHFHPDKNKEEDADERFREVAHANEYLQTYLEIQGETVSSEYDSILTSLLYSMFDNPGHSAMFVSICGQIRNKSWDMALHTFAGLGRKTAMDVIEYITSFKDVLGIDDVLIQRFREKIDKTEHVVLNPTLDNLLNKDVYCLDLSGKILYIPLWHEEMCFDLSRGHVVVTNNLQLPEHIAIDHNNDLHLHVRHSLIDAFEVGIVPVKLGDKVFELSISDLHIRRQQTTRLKGSGGPRINLHDLFDAEQTGDVIVHLELY